MGLEVSDIGNFGSPWEKNSWKRVSECIVLMVEKKYKRKQRSTTHGQSIECFVDVSDDPHRFSVDMSLAAMRELWARASVQRDLEDQYSLLLDRFEEALEENKDLRQRRDALLAGSADGE